MDRRSPARSASDSVSSARGYVRMMPCTSRSAVQGPRGLDAPTGRPHRARSSRSDRIVWCLINETAEERARPVGYTETGALLARPRILGCVPMAGAVEHPDIRYVVYPVHLDGTLTGAKPRLRHDPGCSHFEWGDGTLLGTPLATEEQMRTLNACKTCIERRGESPKDARQSMRERRTGGLCPTCNQVMPLTGICDNCGA